MGMGGGALVLGHDGNGKCRSRFADEGGNRVFELSSSNAEIDRRSLCALKCCLRLGNGDLIPTPVS